MVSFTDFFLTSLLAAAGLGSALPPQISTTKDQNGRLTLKQVRNPRPHKAFNPARATYRTFLKYGVPAPDYIKKAITHIDDEQEEAFSRSKRDTGSAAAIPINEVDIAYVTPVTVGTPPQTLMLDLDTGSSDLWVFSSLTPSSQVRGQDIYTPANSSTSKLLNGHTWSIRYGDGSGSRGTVYLDTLAVGGLEVKSQAVQTAQEVSSSFTQEQSLDGLMGLGFSTLNTVRPSSQLTFFDNARPSLDEEVFTADLKYHATGSYDFGFVDRAKYTGNISYTAVTESPGYWTHSLSGYAVGSGAFQTTRLSGISDTGTTLLYLPTAVVTAYYRQVQGAQNSQYYGGYVFPCSSSLPTFTFGIEEARFTIPASYINYTRISPTSTTCYGGLQSSSGLGINIFGDVALKAAFVVFSGTNPPRIGFAHKPLDS
ncbi:pepsin precursor [Triangularia setosa]|uniref:Pepsin n=1 Tax=Triangularia setosa TaxID=2587417 RepID=A0AAN7A619_9PEZI|nr:pepsin precursor [Podospora setosa]